MNFLVLLSLIGFSVISANVDNQQRHKPSSCSDGISSIDCYSSSTRCSSSSSLHENTKCSRKLQAIIHRVDVPEFVNFNVDKLEAEFKLFSPALFTEQNASYVWAFEQKWGITVNIFDGFSYGWKYSVGPNAVEYVPFSPTWVTYAKTFLNRGGYAYSSKKLTHYYSFPVWNVNGELLIVTFSKVVQEQNPIPDG